MRVAWAMLGAAVFVTGCGGTRPTEYREGPTSACQLGLLEYCPQNTLANPGVADIERRYFAAGARI